MKMRFVLNILLGLCLILSVHPLPVWSQRSGDQAGHAMRLEVDMNPLIIKTQKKQIRFEVEIATSPQETSRGLMFRTDFPKNRAMLFIFDGERMISMWMKNTPLPLDMLFVDAQGKIISILAHAEPFSETVISSGWPANYVIEINAGQAQLQGIREGDLVIHPSISTPSSPE